MRKVLILISSVLISCFSYSQSTSKPFVLGSIETMESTILSETRTLNIYLPEGYHPDSSANYPVIYLLDGSVDEDFIHIAGLIQFYNFPWIDRVPKSIIVGIANTDRRRDFTFPAKNFEYATILGYETSDLTTTGGSAKFISFIESELQPFIEKKFKTNSHKTIIGQSLGGLLASEILLTKPHLFNVYLILSPSLWWDNESLLTKAPDLIKAITRNLKIYIGVGNEGNVMVNDAKKLYQLIKKHGQSMDVYYDFLPKDDHATMSHLAVYNAFQLLYPKK